jgi:hypothetical protein
LIWLMFEGPALGQTHGLYLVMQFAFVLDYV